MSGNKREDRWRELCHAIVQEGDSKRLMELVEQLNRILEQQEESVVKKNRNVTANP